jgi:hypothetical protein
MFNHPVVVVGTNSLHCELGVVGHASQLAHVFEQLGLGQHLFA